MLRPDVQWKNPVMFVVEVGTFLTLAYIIRDLWIGPTGPVPISYFIAVDVWLFLTVLFANFATALAEARGKAQAQSLRKARHETIAYLLKGGGRIEEASSTDLKPGDEVMRKGGTDDTRRRRDHRRYRRRSTSRPLQANPLPSSAKRAATDRASPGERSSFPTASMSESPAGPATHSLTG